MKHSLNQVKTQGKGTRRSMSWRVGGLSLLIVLSLTLTGCQWWPSTKNQASNSISSLDEAVIQPAAKQSTAELWLDPESLAVMIKPSNMPETLSGISVRLIIKPTTTDVAFELSSAPFILPQLLIDQGWTAVINTSTPTPSGETWADLAIINTQPEGIALTDTTAIANLAPVIQGNWANINSSLTIDPDLTKVLTKSAQEVDLSILEMIVTYD